MLPWYEYLIVFGIGGLICMLGQILIITTKITTARTAKTPIKEKIFLNLLFILKLLCCFTQQVMTDFYKAK